MDQAWPAPDREDTGSWVLRAAAGVTQRANSVWPRDPAEDPEAAIRAASLWYRSRRLPLIFQVFDHHRSAALNEVLDAQRFTRQSETLVMVRGAEDLPQNRPAGVELSEEPSEEWLHLWWSVDGRGGDAERGTARQILTACPSLYALLRDDDGVPAAVGRLAVPDGGAEGWGGIYSMATSAAHRRRGYGTRVLAALLNAGAKRGLEGFWLLVTAANQGAQELYRNAGFAEQGGYLYRQAPLKRAPGGC
ncbi:GNAT family N-acetyltransferase [Arthrobacter sp. CJ23]|uniref:GNAT family N-acetyltransferase n=1 Tax=Arthrobacter sp. CJ23 TaxID=2972479 RepID=UPI00215CF059|nr:GNAT family N-acetyltransferase [Arthrobacter sp. CJ23]UVJ41597.1 GNAT family N-acetyltransferase [Arthrobacter sp. CJ23]